jgi:hypothetical protein
MEKATQPQPKEGSAATTALLIEKFVTVHGCIVKEVKVLCVMTYQPTE